MADRTFTVAASSRSANIALVNELKVIFEIGMAYKKNVEDKRESPRFEALGPHRAARLNAVLIATDHDDVDWAAIVANAEIVVDSRNVCHREGATGGNTVKA